MHRGLELEKFLCILLNVIKLNLRSDCKLLDVVIIETFELNASSMVVRSCDLQKSLKFTIAKLLCIV